MQILIAGSASHAAIEKIYERHLSELGAEVELFDIRRPFGIIHILPAKLVRLIRRFFPQAGLLPINNLLKNKVREQNFEVLWVFKGMEILPSTLDFIRNKGVFTVNFNPDHPFFFTGPGSGNKLITKALPTYNAHLTYHSGVAEILNNKFSTKVAILPFGFDLSTSEFDQISDEEEILKVGFVGSADEDRASYINAMLHHGIEVDVFGSGWDKWLAPASNLAVHGPVYGLEFWKTLRKYRVQLNTFRPHNIGSHNMRSFDIPGSGGIMLAPESEEHLTFFQNGTDAVFFKDKGDAVLKAVEILQWSKEQALSVRNQARAHAISKGYHYRKRSETALNLFNYWIITK